VREPAKGPKPLHQELGVICNEEIVDKLEMLALKDC
jgi:hypothetical protein